MSSNKLTTLTAVRKTILPNDALQTLCAFIVYDKDRTIRRYRNSQISDARSRETATQKVSIDLQRNKDDMRSGVVLKDQSV